MSQEILKCSPSPLNHDEGYSLGGRFNVILSLVVHAHFSFHILNDICMIEEVYDAQGMFYAVPFERDRRLWHTTRH